MLAANIVYFSTLIVIVKDRSKTGDREMTLKRVQALQHDQTMAVDIAN
jgi:hypothetical protein